MHLTQQLVGALALTILASAPAAQLSFGGASAPIVSDFVWDIDVIDLDGDGTLDMVLSVPVADAGLVVFAGLGDGQFDDPQVLDVGGWGDATAVGDVDGDGDLDLVTAVKQAASLLTTTLNDGSGGLSVAGSSVAGDLPEDVALGDFDGDGDLDAVLANWNGSGSASFLLGDGAGGFGSEVQTATVGGKSFAAATADLDGDGDLEALTVCYGANATDPGRLHVFDNPGDGSFGAPTTLNSGRGTWAVDVGDIDNDGDLDVMTTNRNTDTVSVFANDRGSLVTAVDNPVGSFPVDGHLADLDGDGDLDAAVGSNQSSDVYVLENDGSGAFTTALVIDSELNHYCGAVGDMDGDGDVEIWAGGSGHLDLYDNLAAGSSAFSDLGPGLGGTLEPSLLVGGGSLAGGTTATLDLSGGLPGAAATLVSGLGFANVPFKGGTLYPSPDVLIGPLILDGAGELHIAGTWPGGLPAFTHVFLQVWFADAGAPAGFAASNGLLGVTP